MMHLFTAYSQQILIETIFEHIPQYVFWKDKNSVYLGCNERYAQLLGLKHPQDIVGRTDYEIGWLPDGDTADTFRQGDQATLRGRSIKNQEEWLSLPNGTKILTLINKVPLMDDQKTIIGVLGVATDITEKKKIEEKLAKTRHQLQGMMIVSATIAHELRTPLATIKNSLIGIQQFLPDLITGYAAAQAKHLAIPSINHAQLKLLATVIHRLEHKVDEANNVMDMLLTNINGYANGKVHHTRCSAIQCIQKALAQYPFPAGLHSKVQFIPQLDQNFSFYGQEALIIHVLFNLLKNALYFIQKANRGEICIWLEQKQHHNEIHFKDTAQGVKPEHLPHIFEPFYTRGTNKGTGVGLAFCHTILASCHGHIHCESVYGQYCEFILQFPHPKSKPQPPAKEAHHAKNYSLLLPPHYRHPHRR